MSSSAAANRKAFVARMKIKDPEFYETMMASGNLDLGDSGESSDSEQQQSDDDSSPDDDKTTKKKVKVVKIKSSKPAKDGKKKLSKKKIVEESTSESENEDDEEEEDDDTEIELKKKKNKKQDEIVLSSKNSSSKKNVKTTKQEIVESSDSEGDDEESDGDNESTDCSDQEFVEDEAEEWEDEEEEEFGEADSDDGGLAECDVDDLYGSDEDGKKKKKLKSNKKTNEDDDSEGGDGDEGEEEGKGGRVEITEEMVETWRKQLESSQPREAFLKVSRALLAIVPSLNNVAMKDQTATRYYITSPGVCDDLLAVSTQNMTEALRKMLDVSTLKHISASKHFRKHAKIIKAFLHNILQVQECITSGPTREVILESVVLPLLPCYRVQPKQCKLLVKRMVTTWSTGHKQIRVLAFRALFKIIKMMNVDMHDITVKMMYLNYVRNCMFTSARTLDCIHFMRVSLAELYSFNHALAYKHVFVFVRQQASILRNAIIANKQEKFQAVYNWQFVHSLHMWSTVLAVTHPSDILRPLVHPLVEVALGTLKLHGGCSPRYWPLVLRICDMLTHLSAHVSMYIPVLQHLVQVYCSINNSKVKKPKKTKRGEEEEEEKKPNWRCVLKFSKSELLSYATMDKLLQETAKQITYYLTTQAHKISFPDMVAPIVMQLKKSRDKLCPGMAYTLVQAITEQADYINDRRQKVTFGPHEQEEVTKWEDELKNSGEQLPMIQFHEKIINADADYAWWIKKSKRKLGESERMLTVRKYDKATDKHQNSKRRRIAGAEGDKALFSAAKITNAKETIKPLSLDDLS